LSGFTLAQIQTTAAQTSSDASKLSDVALTTPTPTPHPDDIRWDDRFEMPGVDYNVAAIAVDGTDIYVGGVAAPYILRWDGRRWYSLGAGVNGKVYAILVHGDDVYVGGEFTQASMVTANSIAKWNKTTGKWSAVGSGVGPLSRYNSQTSINTLAWLNDELIVGGDRFTRIDSVDAYAIAKFNPATNQWSSMGKGVTQGYDYAGQVYTLNVGSNGKLYVGGDFKLAESTSQLTVNNIAEWDSTTNQWRALGTESTVGTDKAVTALTSVGDLLYIGGKFTTAGGITVNRIAQWSTGGQTWGTLKSGITTQYDWDAGVNTLAEFAGLLYVCGDFATAGGIVARNCAKWNPTTLEWAAMNVGDDFEEVDTVVAGTGRLYIGGKFTVVNNQSVNKIAAYDGTDFHALGLGIEGDQLYDGAYTMAVHPNGQVFVGGQFTHLGGKPARNIGIWDGSQWITIGNTDRNVYALAIWQDDVYVAGEFTTINQMSANHIARWSIREQKWYPLGSGVDGIVVALTVAPDGTLFVGGKFTAAGNVSARNVAMWTPATSTWAKLGRGDELRPSYNGIYVLLADAEGVYIGGYIPKLCFSDTPCYSWEGWSVNNLTYWKRATNEWYRFGEGLSNAVSALALAEDGLYVGGRFTKAGSVATTGIAKLGEAGWSAVSNGIAGCGILTSVYELTVIGQDVYVSGCFTIAGSVTANNIARWNLQTQTWSPLGSGLDVDPGKAYDLRRDFQPFATNGSTLFVGGSIDRAGGKPSSGIALWSLTAPTPTPTPLPKLTAQSNTTGAPGSRFVFTGSGFPANHQVSVSLLKTEISAADSTQSLAGTIQSDANGHVSFTLVTPATLAAGNYYLAVGTVSTAITIDASAPLQQPTPQGESVTVEVIELSQRAFLPLVAR
jgi:hypothetical protein